MSQRAALLVSAALTALILVAGVVVTARILSRDPAVDEPGDLPSRPDAAADVDSNQDITYLEVFDRLQEANAALATSYDRIASLLDKVDELQSQNTQLREREVLYQQRLAEANSRLESQGQTAVTVPPAKMRADGRGPQSGHDGGHDRD